MGIFSAAIELCGVGGRTRSTGSPSDSETKAKSTVLVINDDPMLLQTVKSLLVKHGCNVLTSSSARKGLEMLHYAARDIRIVVLDYDMANLNGDETLKFIKQHGPHAKVVGITSMKFDSLPGEYIDGTDKLLTKTMVATGLLDAVDELLGDGLPHTSA
jgi:DNA-binding NtrC family response regulator